MLHAVGHVGGQEPRVVVGQVVVDAVAAGDRTVGVDSVDIVISGADTQFSLQQTSCHEHQAWRDDQLARTGCDQQAAFVFVSCDVDNSLFQRGLVQVGSSGWAVCVRATSNGRVRCVQQAYAVARQERGEACVQQRSCLNLLRIGHGAGQCLGVTSRQRVVQVIFHSFFGNREAHGHRLVVITSGERFLCVVKRDGRAFRFNWSCAEAAQLDFFFERTFGGFGLVDVDVLVFVFGVLKTKQGVQARQKFFECLCA